jgi:predicted metal-dependent hydrolase
MAQKTFALPDVGEVIVAKRRGSRAIRLSVRSDGKVRVGIPYFVPYAAGLNFAQARKDWIINQQSKHPASILKEGDLIGKSHRLRLVSGQRLAARIRDTELLVSVPAGTEARQLQLAIVRGAERALKAQAEHLLPQRLAELAAQYGYKTSSLQIKKLTSRWGSCSRQGKITLNYFLMQLPWSLIDYVILHELVHTRHFDHSKAFWEELSSHIPDARSRQKTIRAYKTSILAG